MNQTPPLITKYIEKTKPIADLKTNLEDTEEALRRCRRLVKMLNSNREVTDIGIREKAKNLYVFHYKLAENYTAEQVDEIWEQQPEEIKELYMEHFLIITGATFE